MHNPFIFEIPPLQPSSAGVTPVEDRTAITARKYKQHRKGVRKLSAVKALVLHHTASGLRNEPERLDHIVAHFVIPPNGRILQLHPLESVLWASHGFNNSSVAVEFVGNFRNEKGKCWFGPRDMRPCANAPTAAQIKAGRDLIRYLINKIGLTHVYTHRQSSWKDGDPGPDVWYHVGQWAVDNLGLSDGGPGFFVGGCPVGKKTCAGKGSPIPASWRTWGNRS
jgi:N-acetyl-anhydromuramyl-L-alanine amidase AmpD